MKGYNDPIKIENDVWFYQNPKSLHFVVWVTGRDNNRVSKSFLVSWRKIEKTLMVKNAKKKPKKRNTEAQSLKNYKPKRIERKRKNDDKDDDWKRTRALCS